MPFINFLLRPEMMAAITNQSRYPNAVPASLPLVAAGVQDDPNVFPPAAALARAFVPAPLPPGRRARAHPPLGRFKAGPLSDWRLLRSRG